MATQDVFEVNMIRRVLLITQDFPPEKGGIQTYCKHLAIELYRHGCVVTVICPRSKSANAEVSNMPKDITVIRMPVGTSWLWLPLLFSIGRILKKHRPDAIIYGQWQCGIWHLFHPSLARKYVTTSLIHGRDLLTGLFRQFSPVLCARVLKTVRIAIPNSRTVASLYVATLQKVSGVTPVGMKGTPMHGVPVYKTVHPGIDTSRFVPTDHRYLKDRYRLHDKLILTTVTRLVARKNVAAVIRLMPRIQALFPNVHYVIGGSGPEKATLEMLAGELQIEDAITFTGEIKEEEIVAHMSLGDVFVLPSTQDTKDIEGFGIVFLEASCCGVPQVAFPTGGIPDAVEHNVSGLLCDSATDEALFDTLVQLLQSAGLRRTLGQQGRERAILQFTWENNAEQILNVISGYHQYQHQVSGHGVHSPEFR
jgi:phosphatidyl-myo-inositol dimannoside synthase